MTEHNKSSGRVIPILKLENAKSAIELYQRALGAKVLEIHFDSKEPNIVVHAELQIEDSSIFIDDIQACIKYAKESKKVEEGVTKNAKLYLYVEDADTAFEKAVSNGMKETEPMQDAFWGHRFGAVVDDYGIGWCFSTPKSTSSKNTSANDNISN